MSEVVVKLPKYLSKDETEKLVRLLYAIELFRRGVVSIGRAVEIAGVSYQEFLEELLKRCIDPYEYDEDELAKELLE